MIDHVVKSFLMSHTGCEVTNSNLEVPVLMDAVSQRKINLLFRRSTTAQRGSLKRLLPVLTLMLKISSRRASLRNNHD